MLYYFYPAAWFGVLVGLLEEEIPIRDAAEEFADVDEVEVVGWKSPFERDVVDFEVAVWGDPFGLDGGKVGSCYGC